MSEKNQDEAPVVGNGKANGIFVGSKRRIAAVVSGVIVLVLIAGVAFYVRHENAEKDKQAQVKRNIARSVEAKNAVDVFRAKGDYTAALQEADRYIKNAPNNENVVTMLTTKGALYEEMGDNKQAYDTYKMAEQKAGKDMYGFDRGIARTAEQLGDKQTAITYYKKCLQILQKNGQKVRLMDIAELQDKLRKLEAEV